MARAGHVRPRGTARALGLAVALVVPVAGCGQQAEPSDRPVVTVFGSFTDRDADSFIASMAAFERSSGIDVRYVGSARFEADLLERVRRGSPPDLALVPQPGLVQALAEDGLALPYDGELADAGRRDVDERLVGLVTVGDEVFGSWYSLSPKSLVWYSPAEFRARALTIPATWDELIALTDEIEATGTAPWCLGVRDGGATGWVATDWVEDIVLRFAGPGVYDQWITHEVGFTDERITDAVDRFGSIALDAGRVNGGNRAAVEYTVQDAANQLLGGSPECLLHRQASFLTDFVEDGLDVSPNGDLWVFPFPGPAEAAPSMLVGGTVAARFTDRPETRQLAEYLTTAEAATERARLGGFISALDSVATDDYPAVLNRTIAGWASDAEVLRFDASDLMPPEVGVGAFWEGMNAWLGGARLTSTMAAIDDAWPVEIQPRVEAEDRGASAG